MSDLKNNPKISVIVPVYNVEKYLRRCLDSIAAQTFTDWECICVDDGSPDGSGAICDEYARDDSRFVVIHKENGGVSSARNAGLDAARGEWIGFVDSDDWIEKETYEIAYKTAKEKKVSLVQWDYFSDDGERHAVGLALAEGFFSVARDATYFCPSMWHKLVFSKLICDNGLRFPEYTRLSEDRLFAFQCVLLAGEGFHLNRPFYHYVVNTSSASHNITREMIFEEVKVVKKMEAFALGFAGATSVGGTGGGYDKFPLVLSQKFEAKYHALLALSKPDIRLARSIFPETNAKVWKNFLLKKTRSAFLLVLVAMRLDVLARLAILLWRRIAG